jgi:isoquinoline 1-oxidoreductase beta subunit
MVNSNTVVAQMESGIIFGLTAALFGEITINEGQATEGNFDTYKMLHLADAPTIETYIIEGGLPLGGVGEPGTPPIAPAITNAIFAAIGKRLRNLPIRNHDLSSQPLY